MSLQTIAKITLDFYNKNMVCINAKQYDSARIVEITCSDRGLLFAPDKNAISAFVRLRKPDSLGVFNLCEINDEGKILVELTEQTLAAPGKAIADVFLIEKVFTSGEKPIDIDDISKINAPVLSTMNFTVNITPTALEHSQIESSYEFNALTNALAQIDYNNKKVEELDKTLTENENIRITNENERQINENKRISAESERINAENTRKSNEVTRQKQESDRQTNTAIAIANAEVATKKANDAADDLQAKLDAHHFVLTEDKDIAGGVPSLDSNTKVPIAELYEATTTTKGITQLTDSVTSTSTTTAATPKSVKSVKDSLTSEINRATTAESDLDTKKANIASPTLTGTPKAPTATAGTNTTQIATTAFVQKAVSDGIAASDALIFKGTLGTSGTITALPTTYKTGWTYRVITAGTYAGQVCEIGDLIVALVDRSDSGNLDADWCVAQTNINGAITGIKSGDAYITTSQSGSVVTITHKDVTRTNTTSTVSPSSGSTFTAVDSVISDSKGHITRVNTKTIILPTTVGTISLTGDVTGSGTFNGSGSLNIKTTVTNGGHYIGTFSPSNTNLLWIDTSNSGILKYYDGTKWVEIAGSAEILDSMQSYLTRAQALYDSMYLDCDGETPKLRVVTLIKIKGGTPQQRLIDGGISFDGGTPTSRLLGA